MNNTFNISDEKVILERINAKTADQMTPVIAYLVILMCVGLIGNVLVVLFYGRNAKNSTHFVFICTLAIYDLISCGISIPSEIATLRLFFTYDNSIACKIFRFVNHFAAIGSIGVLLEISIDRYRKICRPFRRQLNHNQTKVACAGSIVGALFFSWPSLVFCKAVPVDVRNENGQQVTGYTCTTTKEEKYRNYLWIFNSTHFVIFICFTIILCVMYALVWSVLLKRKTYSETSEVSAIGVEPSYSGDSMDRSTQSARMAVEMATQPSHTKPRTVRLTMLMVVITVVFVVSFLPFFLLVIWRAKNGTFESDFLSDSDLVAFQFGIRSYLFSSAINPFMYGFFNSEFREYVRKVVCAWKR
ncbi:neuromedin-U receptor 2-like [Mya arenaria]|uniref:neuromedin-U receptor 2-like n=1 Tax=Mya arenaria TaxID=6604 RepID=UPI0022E53D4B|nr:neuromedin-U receptor 2-like [Mya arenaria]